MVFLESYARLLLILHAVVATAMVASSTHLVIWMRGYRRGRFHRHRSVKRFAVITCGLYLATFLLGNLLYPTYKVRVRAQYFDNPQALSDDYQSRAAARAQTLKHRTGAADQRLSDDQARAFYSSGAAQTVAKVARWFDVKEHWAALGLAIAIGCTVLLWGWDPKSGGQILGPLSLLMAVAICVTAWSGAIIGFWVTSYRSVGSLGGL